MRRPTVDRKAKAQRLGVAAIAAAGLLLAACGGGGGSAAGTTEGGGTVSGTATKGPVANATMTAFAVTNGGAKGAQLATGGTDAQGHFTMQIGTYSGPVFVEMHGGSYTDEATNATMPMGDDVMTGVIPSFAAGSSTTIQVTPLTSMAQAMAQAMAGGMTPANVTAANNAMGSYFSAGDILHTPPMDPLAAGSGSGASQDMKNYGMSIAAMSQYAKTLGMTTSSAAMVTAMMDDASDGTMNGMMGSTPISMSGMGGMMGGTMMPSTSGTSALAAAMAEFVASGMNRSGVSMADMQPLIDKLDASSGTIR